MTFPGLSSALVQKRAVILSGAGRATTGAVEGSAVAFPPLASAPKLRAPSSRLFSGAKVGNLMRVLLILAVIPVAAQSPQVIAITGAKLLTVSHGTIDNGVLVMADGKITAVGRTGEVTIPKDAKVVDAKGMTVYPGLIDPESNFGLTEISADQMTNDLVERSDEIMPHMHVYDAFHAETELIPVARLNGITNAVVAPASGDTLPGQDSFIQLDGRSANDMLMIRDIAMPLNFTAEQRRNESWDKRKFPS